MFAPVARFSFWKGSPALGLSDAQEGFWKKEIVVLEVVEAVSRKKRKSEMGNGAIFRRRGVAHLLLRLKAA
jgi:hypothetical protein